MKTAFIVFLALCLVSVHAFVERDTDGAKVSGYGYISKEGLGVADMKKKLDERMDKIKKDMDSKIPKIPKVPDLPKKI